MKSAEILKILNPNIALRAHTYLYLTGPRALYLDSNTVVEILL
jgi:hypothetical protein